MDVCRTAFVAICLVFAAVPLHAAEKPLPANRSLLICYGDSITAGYGVPYGEAYPNFLQKILDARGYQYKVENRGTSGATTKDAVAGLPFILRLHPAIVIVEFGGNDGLRGLPLTQTRDNLDQVVAALQAAHIEVLLAGITLPPDYGPDYIHSFEQIFSSVAAKYRTAFVPMIYKNLIHVPATIQPDGIHPTVKGAGIIAETLFPALKPLLHKPASASATHNLAHPGKSPASFAESFARLLGRPALTTISELAATMLFRWARAFG